MARELNPELRAIIEVAKVMYKSKKYPHIKWTDIIKIAKLVVNHAKRQTKSDDLEVVKERAMELIENPDQFIKIYNSQKVMPQEVPG
jgi:DNA repair protein RadC